MMNFMEIKKEITKAKNREQLDELRGPIVEAMKKENNIELFNDMQKLFIKQKNKIKRHGGRINDN